MNVLALFAGVGGLELGIGLAVRGARAVCYVERDAFAAAVLVARMEDATLAPAPIWDDVSTFDGKPWRGVVDCVAGGFPCQDISVAGSGAGLDGARSGLWSEYARIVRETGPRFVFVENVPALTSRGLDRVLGDLADLGFDAEWDMFSAEGVGAPHERDRVFILAASVDQVPVLRGLVVPGSPDPRIQVPVPGDRRADGAAVLSDACGAGLEGGWYGGSARHGARWSPEPDMDRVDDGTPHRVDRLRCLGNGVVPAVAARAWRELSARLVR